MPAPTTQTFTPSLIPYADKRALVDEFVGRKLSSLRTPALIVDRVGFARNCDFVTGEIKAKGLGFRAHIKSECVSERASEVWCVARPWDVGGEHDGRTYRVEEGGAPRVGEVVVPALAAHTPTDEP